MLHSKQIHTLHGLARRVNVLSTHSTWLLGSLSMGCDGLLSGAGSVIADLQAAMLDAVLRYDLKRALELEERMFPIVRLFYADPYLDMHNRMKELLAHIGRISAAFIRPPQCRISEQEKDRLFKMAENAGIQKDGMKDLVY